MLKTLSATLVVVFGAVAAAAYFAFFIVHQNEQAIVLEFGKPVKIISDPGLYWKIPVVQTVDYFDKRILDLDTRLAGGDGIGSEAHHRRCFRSLSHHRPASVLSNRSR